MAKFKMIMKRIEFWRCEDDIEDEELQRCCDEHRLDITDLDDRLEAAQHYLFDAWCEGIENGDNFDSETEFIECEELKD